MQIDFILLPLPERSGAQILLISAFTQNVNQLLIYFPCNCEGIPTTDFSPYSVEFLKYVKTKFNSYCNIASQIAQIEQQY